MSNVFPYITAAVALYGAGLATYNTFTQRKEKKKRIKVTLTPVMGNDFSPRMKVEALNVGSKPVIIKKLGIITKDKKDHEYYINDIPWSDEIKEITEGLAVSGTRLLADMESELIDATPYCEDTLGKRYFGRKTSYKIGMTFSDN